METPPGQSEPAHEVLYAAATITTSTRPFSELTD